MLKFYRKITYEDLDAGRVYWFKTLSFETRKLIEDGSRATYSAIRNETNLSLYEAKALADEYAVFLKVLEDWKENKDIYTNY